jgi:hypothetical protein
MSAPAKPSHISNKLIFGSIAIGLVIIMLILVFTFGFGGIQYGVQRTLPPSVEITSKNARDGYIGLDYTLWIDVSVHNTGGAGTVTVWAKVTQGSNEWTKSQTIYLDAKGSKDLTFEFREISFWSLESGYYSVWVTY